MKVFGGRMALNLALPSLVLCMILLVVDASSLTSSTWQLLDLATSTISKLSSGDRDTIIGGDGIIDNSARTIDTLSCSIVELYEGFYSNEVSSIFC